MLVNGMINRRDAIRASLAASIAALCPDGLLGSEAGPQYEETSESSVASGGGSHMYELLDVLHVSADGGTRNWFFRREIAPRREGQSLADWHRKYDARIREVAATCWACMRGLSEDRRRMKIMHRTVRVYKDESVETVDCTPAMIYSCLRSFGDIQ